MLQLHVFKSLVLTIIWVLGQLMSSHTKWHCRGWVKLKVRLAQSPVSDTGKSRFPGKAMGAEQGQLQPAASDHSGTVRIKCEFYPIPALSPFDSLSASSILRIESEQNQTLWDRFIACLYIRWRTPFFYSLPRTSFMRYSVVLALRRWTTSCDPPSSRVSWFTRWVSYFNCPLSNWGDLVCSVIPYVDIVPLIALPALLCTFPRSALTL